MWSWHRPKGVEVSMPSVIDRNITPRSFISFTTVMRCCGDRPRRSKTIETVCKRPNDHSFIVAPRRWVVERAFAILGRARRLTKDYEREDLYSESMVDLASIGSLLRRFTGNALTASRYHVSSTADGY
jgi:hypothetical protein